MTILHVIALAGGLDRHGLEPWQKVETVREVEKRRGAAEAMVKLLARSIVLKAERDGEAAKPSLQLLGLVNEAEARQLIAESISRRNFILDARRTRDSSLCRPVRGGEAGSANAVEPSAAARRSHQASARARQRRQVLSPETYRARGCCCSLRASFQKPCSAAGRLWIEAATAQQRAKLLEQDKAKLDADTRGDLENEISATDQQIATEEREFASSEGVLDTLTAARAEYIRSKEAQATFAYEIVRQTANGPISLIADGMSTLRPGDLVRITTSREQSQPRLCPSDD